jgi:hypothetical protein
MGSSNSDLRLSELRRCCEPLNGFGHDRMYEQLATVMEDHERPLYCTIDQDDPGRVVVTDRRLLILHSRHRDRAGEYQVLEGWLANVRVIVLHDAPHGDTIVKPDRCPGVQVNQPQAIVRVLLDACRELTGREPEVRHARHGERPSWLPREPRGT